jgi:hypothetical protein
MTNWEGPEAEPAAEDPPAAAEWWGAVAGRAFSRAPDSTAISNSALKMDKQTEDFTAGPPGSEWSLFPLECPSGGQDGRLYAASTGLGETARAPGFCVPQNTAFWPRIQTIFFVISLECAAVVYFWISKGFWVLPVGTESGGGKTPHKRVQPRTVQLNFIVFNPLSRKERTVEISWGEALELIRGEMSSVRA